MKIKLVSGKGGPPPMCASDAAYSGGCCGFQAASE